MSYTPNRLALQEIYVKSVLQEARADVSQAGVLEQTEEAARAEFERAMHSIQADAILFARDRMLEVATRYPDSLPADSAKDFAAVLAEVAALVKVGRLE